MNATISFKLFPFFYFKFLFQKYFLDLFCVDCHAFIKARPLCAPHGDDNLNKLCNDRKKFVITSGSEVIHIQNLFNSLITTGFSPLCRNFIGKRNYKSKQGVRQRRPLGKTALLSTSI